MKKKVLAIYYSQSGQLTQILDRFTEPFRQQDWQVDTCQIKPKTPYDFPWTTGSFFDAMPESVLGIPTELPPYLSGEEKYDLIILGYQPWFLSPSIPIHSLLQSQQFKKVLEGVDVITLIGSRNMWLNAQEKVKLRLKEAGARLKGNIALVDKHHNLISVVTILHWMLSGRKDRFLNIFPLPGVSDEDIQHCAQFGEIAVKHYSDGATNDLQEDLIATKAVEVNTSLMFIEQRAGKLFQIWANIIIRRKNRKAWLAVFKYYLLFALFIIAPIVLLINGLLFQPFLGKSIQRKKRYFQQL